MRSVPGQFLCVIAEVRSVLGLTSYYRRFVHGYVKIAKPLYELTENGKEFVWTQECDKAFGTGRGPILAYPTIDDQFILDIDAGGVAIVAVLSQVQEGNEREIAYYSRASKKAETNYRVTCCELLAVVDGVRHFIIICMGRSLLFKPIMEPCVGR